MRGDIFKYAIKQADSFKTYDYQIIRYYPFVASDEFFNIGVKIEEDYILLQDEHLENFLRCSFVNREIFEDHFESFKKSGFKRWYGEYIRVCETETIRTDKTKNEILKILYDKYVGYKFKTKNKSLKTSEKVKELTKEIIKSEFKKLTYKEDENNIYDLFIIKNKIVIPLFFGSLSNSSDIQRITIPYLKGLDYPKKTFGYTNTFKKDNTTIQNTISFLNRLETDVKDFSSEKNIVNSLHSIST